MRKFKENFKIALNMKWKGFKYPEIAEKLGVSLDTVKSWFRSNGLLRTHYEDYVHDQLLMHDQERKKVQKNTLIHLRYSGEKTGINGK